MVGLHQHALPGCSSQEEQPHTSCCEMVPRKPWLHNGLHCVGLTTTTILSEMSSQCTLLERSPSWANTRAMRGCIFLCKHVYFILKEERINTTSFLFLKVQLPHGCLSCLQQCSLFALTALLVCKCQARNYQSPI